MSGRQGMRLNITSIILGVIIRMKSKSSIAAAIIRALSSQYFFAAIVVLLVVQAVWIALTGLYPMAFDENFHLGVIRLYAEHPSPFWAQHPAAGDAFGAVTRDPSYLFHYLMSFPYRFVGLLTDNQSAQVIVLRLLNIGFFATSLFLFRQLLLMTKTSRPLVHTSLFIFVLVPVVPLLAAQINYDNVITPLTALALLLTVTVQRSFKTTKMNSPALLTLLAVCLFASVIKYAFLPICIAIAGFVAVTAWQAYRTPTKSLRAFRKGLDGFRGWPLWLLVVALLLGGILFLERYGVNVARYHTPVPDCAQVLTYNECQHYGPWIRDYNLEANKEEFNKSPIVYTRYWGYGMWYRLFFAVDGPTTQFQTRAPMLVPGLTAIAFIVGGVIALLLRGRAVWKRYDKPILWLFVATTVVYVGILWAQQYQMYLQTARPVAINGRYLIPLLPTLILLVVLAWNQLLANRIGLKVMMAGLAVLGFAWGGGALTYILRSNDAWYWHVSAVRSVNHAVQQTVGPITPGYGHPTDFLP